MDLVFLPAKAQRGDYVHSAERAEDGTTCIPVRLIIMAGVVVVLLLSAVVTRVQANGAPVDIFLDYIPGTSNWGPQTATGHAVVSVGEGEVVLEVKGLPRLQGEHYQVWLERADTGVLVPVGAFNSDEQGTGELHVLLDDLPYTTYRQLIITVEPTPDTDPDPSTKWSLVGRFPNTEIAREALIRPAQIGREAAKPELLPVTGGSHPAHKENRLWIGVLVLIAGLTIVAWYRRREVTQ